MCCFGIIVTHVNCVCVCPCRSDDNRGAHRLDLEVKDASVILRHSVLSRAFSQSTWQFGLSMMQGVIGKSTL